MLQRVHLRTVPFENLDIHLDRPITLDIDAIVRKIIDDRRGGFCYELNGGFAALLASLGYQVTLHEARVTDTSIPFDHLALVVAIGAERHLVDVGFGAFTDEPLLVDNRDDQQDTAGVFRLADRDDGWIDVLPQGAQGYRFSPEPRPLQDFQSGCSYHQSSADSHFTRSTVCSLRTADGRVTLSGLTLTETINGAKENHAVAAADLGSVLSSRFGVELSEADTARLAGISA